MKERVITREEWSPEIAVQVLAQDENDQMEAETREAIAAEFWTSLALKRLAGMEGREACRETYREVLNHGGWNRWRQAGGVRVDDGIVVNGERWLDVTNASR